MRIIAGQWRGRSLVAPPGLATRPTAERTREALFSILTSRLGSFEGLAVLDGFAGTGALGLEALSRGAAHCTFIEADAAAAKILAANIAKLGAGPRSRLLTTRIESAPPSASPVDLLMLDPPYASALGEAALARLTETGWIGPATLITLETGRGEAATLPGLEQLAQRHYGKAQLTLWQRL